MPRKPKNDNKNVIQPLYLLDLKPIDFKINRFKKALIWNPLIFKFLIWVFLYNEGFEIPLFEYLKLGLDFNLRSIK